MLTDLCADAVQAKPAKQRRYIPQSSERTLDAPDLADDYYLNLLDRGSSNVLSIALGAMCCPLHWAARCSFGTPPVGLRLSLLPLMRTMVRSQVLAGLLMADTLP